MASSALYRYFASREDLLTALIIEAYDDLGARTEAVLAANAARAPADRWVEAAMAIRTWAFEHPHDYALLYGTPIPGYAAPQDTVVPGTRVSMALVSVVRDAAATGRLGPPSESAMVSAPTSRSMVPMRQAIDLDASDEVLLLVLVAWSQLFGLLTFELFGQTKGFVDDDERLFRDAARTMAAQLGLGA
jgi:AcrR family transcriptional regulator